MRPDTTALVGWFLGRFAGECCFPPRSRRDSLLASQAKVHCFQTYLTNGWHYPLVNLEMNKFCFTDELADRNDYLRSMRNLEAA